MTALLSWLLLLDVDAPTIAVITALEAQDYRTGPVTFRGPARVLVRHVFERQWWIWIEAGAGRAATLTEEGVARPCCDEHPHGTWALIDGGELLASLTPGRAIEVAATGHRTACNVLRFYDLVIRDRGTRALLVAVAGSRWNADVGEGPVRDVFATADLPGPEGAETVDVLPVEAIGRRPPHYGYFASEECGWDVHLRASFRAGASSVTLRPSQAGWLLVDGIPMVLAIEELFIFRPRNASCAYHLRQLSPRGYFRGVLYQADPASSTRAGPWRP